MGFSAVKMNATEEMHYIDSYAKVKAVTDRIEAIKEVTPDGFGIAVDFHGRVHMPMAKVLADALSPYNLMFLEEVVLPENEEAFKRWPNIRVPACCRRTPDHPLGLQKNPHRGLGGYHQPDVALTGGILELRKILAMAEAFDIAGAPHAPYGPISLAATIQVDACSPNVFIQEQSLGIHYNRGFDILDFVKNREIFAFSDGFLEIPKGPGLGLDIDEEMVKTVAKEGLVWSNPLGEMRTVRSLSGRMEQCRQ